MYRNFNTTAKGLPFDELRKLAVWSKARTIVGYDPDVWRADCCNAAIRWGDYGNTMSKFGWEIDHVFPVALGGSDDLGNLQALVWQNNRSKGDKLTGGFCVVG